jgi:hypothetical protein
MRNVSDKSGREKKISSITVFKNHAVYEIMWKNIVQPDIPQMTI